MTTPLDLFDTLYALAERVPEALAFFKGSFYIPDARSFQQLPDRDGRWKKVAHVSPETFLWCCDPALVESAIRSALHQRGADYCQSSHGATYLAQFRRQGSGGDPVTDRADSSVLALCRAALKYLGGIE